MKEDRKSFVHELGELAKMARDNIVSTELGDDEYVTVTYKDGSQKRINVESKDCRSILYYVSKEI